MLITEALKRHQTFSFEIFPPRGELPVEKALDVAEKLGQCEPDWISVTFSAGGTGSSMNTAQIAQRIESVVHTSALAHLTCLGSDRRAVHDYVDTLAQSGVQNVLALRGDRGAGREVIDFEHASDLISYLKGLGDRICVGAACYPEGHLEAESFRADIEALKAKQDAGADFLVTQLFFDNELFYRFREACVRARIKIPVVAGIMPFTSTMQIQRMAFTCGATIPAQVIKRLAQAGDDKQAQVRAGIDYAVEQMLDLASNGVDGLHVYTMNKPEVARAAYEALKGSGYFGA